MSLFLSDKSRALKFCWFFCIWADSLKDIDLFLDGSKPVFDKKYLGQTSEQQVASELQWEVDAIQTSLKLHFTLQR
jgi:hypothetical protein